MDIILGGFVDKHGESFDDDTFNALETLMDRNDQQLFAWISGAIEPPADSTEPENLLIARIALAYDNV